MVGHNKFTIFFLENKRPQHRRSDLFLIMMILFFLYTLYKDWAFSFPFLNNLGANITRDPWTLSLTLATRTSLWPKQLFSLDSTWIYLIPQFLKFCCCWIETQLMCNLFDPQRIEKFLLVCFNHNFTSSRPQVL